MLDYLGELVSNGKIDPVSLCLPSSALLTSLLGGREDLQPGAGGAGLQVPGRRREQGQAGHQDGLRGERRSCCQIVQGDSQTTITYSWEINCQLYSSV